MSNIYDEFDAAYGVDDPVQEVVTRHVSPAAGGMPPGGDDDELLEVEKRLNKARYYQTIVKDGVLEDDGSAAASEINAEVSTWARQQMAKLIGRSVPEKRVSDFSEDQVSILKEIADRVLASKNGTPAPDPVVKRVAQPAVKKQPTPRVKEPQVVRQAPQQRPQQARQAAPQKAKQARPDELPRLPDGTVDYDAIPTDQPFVEDGKRYKFVMNPRPPDDGSKPRVKMNITNQVAPAVRMPMPGSKQAWESITAMQSQQTIQAGGNANNNVFPDAGGGILRDLASQVSISKE